MTKHLDITGLFSDLQYGFRAFRSNVNILTVLSECIYNSFDAGGETSAIALDISKAFDKVWDAGLPHKLKAYAVVGPILNTLESFLQERSFEKVESAGELELDLCNIAEWGDRWLVAFNATKTKLLPFNHRRDPLWVHQWP